MTDLSVPEKPTQTNRCPGWNDRNKERCCEPHIAYKPCRAPGSEFGISDQEGRRDRVTCGRQSGHDGAHEGYGFSTTKRVSW